MIKKAVAFIMILCVSWYAGYFWRTLEEPLPDPPARLAFADDAEKQEFKRLLKKHGLEHHVSVVYHDHLGRYFIRDGKRCAFQ